MDTPQCQRLWPSLSRVPCLWCISFCLYFVNLHFLILLWLGNKNTGSEVRHLVECGLVDPKWVILPEIFPHLIIYKVKLTRRKKEEEEEEKKRKKKKRKDTAVLLSFQRSNWIRCGVWFVAGAKLNVASLPNLSSAIFSLFLFLSLATCIILHWASLSLHHPKICVWRNKWRDKRMN